MRDRWSRWSAIPCCKAALVCICDVLCDTKYIMNTIKRIAAAELLLVVPAALFMTALFVRDIQPSHRDIQPSHYEPARTAGRLVDWFSARPLLGLDVFLIALPFAVFVTGCTTLVRSWRREEEFRRAALETLAAVHAQMAMLFIAAATLMAGGILAIVALHSVTD